MWHTRGEDDVRTSPRNLDSLRAADPLALA